MLTLAESPRLSDKATPDDKKLFAHVVDMRRSLLEAWRIGEFPMLSVLGVSRFASTSQRIFLNTSDATRAKRTLFQDAGANNGTNVGVIPNGTSKVSAFTAFGGSDPDNAHAIQIATGATSTVVNATKFGTGTQYALGLQIAGATKTTLNTDAVLSNTGLVAVALTAAENMSIPANYGVVVPDHYTIPAGINVTLGAGAVMQIT